MLFGLKLNIMWDNAIGYWNEKKKNQTYFPVVADADLGFSEAKEMVGSKLDKTIEEMRTIIESL